MIIEGNTIEVGHAEKILFPETGITKQQLIDYYIAAAPYMLPHLHGRPISMQRFPDGISHEGFYQKSAPEYYPSFIKRIKIKLDGAVKLFITVENISTLAYLATQADIPVHTWLSRRGKLNYPDTVIWDLDPSKNDFEMVREGAFMLKEQLESAGLNPFVKTTGSRGVHILVPVKANKAFLKVRNFARKIAEEMVVKEPKVFTTETRKAKRDGKIFIDYLRNGYGQTAAAPYSVRALEGAPVAAPLTWKELENNKINPQTFTILNILPRLKKEGDIWKGIYIEGQELPL